MSKKVMVYVVLPLFLVFLGGCTMTVEKSRQADIEKIKAMESELAQLQGAKGVLENRFSNEIGNNEVSVGMNEKGLVITFVDEVLFDSGKAKLKANSFSKLDKVVRVLKEELSNNEVGIEGHTDNKPIKHSGWKSNWELSAQRALGVLNYIESQGIDSNRLSATGYGEFHPVASNDTKEGRKKNRRVEIIIKPQMTKSNGSAQASEVKEEKPAVSEPAPVQAQEDLK
jgi:chemotaxis protein MotB